MDIERERQHIALDTLMRAQIAAEDAVLACGLEVSSDLDLREHTVTLRISPDPRGVAQRPCSRL